MEYKVGMMFISNMYKHNIYLVIIEPPKWRSGYSEMVMNCYNFGDGFFWQEYRFTSDLTNNWIYLNSTLADV